MNLYVGFSVPNQPVPCGTNTSHLPGSCRGLQLLIIQQRSSGRHGHCLKEVKQNHKKTSGTLVPCFIVPGKRKDSYMKDPCMVHGSCGKYKREKHSLVLVLHDHHNLWDVYMGTSQNCRGEHLWEPFARSCGWKRKPHFETTKKVNNWKGPVFARGPQGCFLKYAV